MDNNYVATSSFLGPDRQKGILSSELMRRSSCWGGLLFPAISVCLVWEERFICCSRLCTTRSLHLFTSMRPLRYPKRCVWQYMLCKGLYLFLLDLSRPDVTAISLTMGNDVDLAH
jgi:hypothetical protein